MAKLLSVLLSAVLVNNFVLSKFMGICPFLGVSKKTDSALGMGGAVIFVMTMAAAVTFPVYNYILVPLQLDYLRTIVFILIIAMFVQLVELILKRFLPALGKSLGIYLPLITTNCAVLGVTILNADSYADSFLLSIVNALGGGIGFALALIIFSGVRERMEEADIPDFFKGLPATLVAASILSLAFSGFSGVVEGLFPGV